MNRQILDDQLKLFKDKENEIYEELKRLDKIEADFLEEAAELKEYELRDEVKEELQGQLNTIEEARSDLRSFIVALEDQKKQITYDFEVNASKFRNKKYKLKKEAIIREKYKKALNPPLKSKKLIWENKDGRLVLLEGHFNGIKLFEIKRGVAIYSLKIVDKETIVYEKVHHSLDLIQLQRKAEAIFSSFLAS